MCEIDLHRHDQFSSFDGFGKAKEIAKLAKKKGLTALGIANHGNMNGVVEHWKACLDEGIKPILGIEAYFQPKFNKKKPKRESFHMCLFAKDLKGYQNINRIMNYANENQRYYKPLIDFDLLEKYKGGIIATSGCIASFISQTIAKGRLDMAEKATERFIEIFGKDFYIEVQPYKLEEREDETKEAFDKRVRKYNLQRLVNIELIKIAKKYKLRIVLTSDSHYGAKEDFDTYQKMHEINGSGEFNDTYKERYMPNRGDLYKRFIHMHKADFEDIQALTNKIKKDMQHLEDSVEMDILGQLEIELPKISKDSAKLLMQHVKKGLELKGLWDKPEYRKRAKEELDVIIHHGFEDYFLIVQDYTLYAKRAVKMVSKETARFWKKFTEEKGYSPEPIKVGPGRGSVCNSLVAFALDITEVDSLHFDIDFSRFMRMDKKKLPDIDLDFETDRRDEVIQYVLAKYPGKAAQICSYGLYKVDNLLNDLVKVCGRSEKYDEYGNELTEQMKKAAQEYNKMLKDRIKDYVKTKIKDDEINYDDFSHERDCIALNKQFNNIIKHFCKMYKKVRYIGTHAAGVAVVGTDLLDYVTVELRGSEKKGYQRTTAYNLDNLELIQVIKFDMLGLRTLSITKELEQLTDDCFDYEWLEDEEVYEYFAQGRTDGIFQFEKAAAKNILQTINADNIHDVIATSALNRPGPLSMKMHELFAHNKDMGAERTAWSKFTNKTYGTIVFQEQATQIARHIGGLDLDDTDKLLKIIKSESNIDKFKDDIEYLRKKFVAGSAKRHKLSREEANNLFSLMIVYSFNQGHATGYGLISLQQMYYKVHYPELFWYITLKYAQDVDIHRLKAEAVLNGNVVLIPHVNYEVRFSLVDIEGENALAEGLQNIKGVGEKAAEAIVAERKKNGKYRSKEEFIERNSYKGSPVNKGVLSKLEEAGALVFNKKTYFERVKKYNSVLYMKAAQGKA